MGQASQSPTPLSSEPPSALSYCDFGFWLKQQRKDRRLTQEDLAERLACSSALVYKLEAGARKPSVQLATLVAEWLEIPEIDRTAFLSFARGGLKLNASEVEARFGHESAGRASGASKGLPVPLTPLIGRVQEVQEAARLLTDGDTRLLTLVGPPGIGKTRLAWRVARELHARFRDGVLYAALATITDPSFVALTVAQAVGLRDTYAESPLDRLEQSLSNKEALLVLDNFEQVLDAAPTVVQLLRACPRLRVMLTSREALHVAGEQQFRVPALATPDPANLPPLATLQGQVRAGEYPAITLFVQRARAVNPGFGMTEQNSCAVAAICARLQGLPLAIELAAARLSLLSLVEIESRLGDSLALLESAATHLPSRQRTVRGAIDWSYRLLSDAEATLFARLGVFVGGCDLAAAEAVCNLTADNPAGSVQSVSCVLEGLASLVNKSLLQREEGVQGESRFTMLELIHDYALERLRASGEAEEIRALHAQHYLALAEKAEEPLTEGTEQGGWLDRLEQEYGNIRGALSWLLDRGHSTAALRLAASMDPYWLVRGKHVEGRQWLEKALAMGDAPDAVRAKALEALGRFAQSENEHDKSAAYLEESLAIYKELGDATGVARTLRTLASTAMLRGDIEGAIALGKEGLTVGFESDRTIETAKLLAVLGGAAWYEADFDQAEQFFAKAVALSREQKNDFVTAASLDGLGLVQHYRGQLDRAQALYEESLSIARRIGARQHIANTGINLAHLELSRGEVTSAQPRMLESLRLFAEMSDKEGISEGVEGMARLASATKQFERAARLFAAAGGLRERHSLPLPSFVRTSYDHIVASIRSGMPEEAFQQAWQGGQGMTIEQALDYALGTAG